MSTSKFIFRSLLNRSSEKVMDWHLRPHMEQRAIPPWESIYVLESSGKPNQEGSTLAVRAKLVGFIYKDVVIEYCRYVPDESFEARQVEGPFIEWFYKMKLREQSGHSCEITDQFNFKHRFPKILTYFINKQFQERFKRILKYKHEVLQNDLDLLDKYTYEKPLKILVSGSSGFVGSALTEFLEFAGHEVWKLSRKAGSSDKKVLIWDPHTSEANQDMFEGFDAVFHLAGDNIAKGWWSSKKKTSILESRYKGTEQLVKLLSHLKKPPKTFICASAVGYYGDRGSEVLSEDSAPGKGLFLTKVCQYWERAARELEEKGIRVVTTRFGMVLSTKGGALKKMLLPFQLGLGGKVGHGHQYVSWIAIDDLIGALYHTLLTPSLNGAVNFTSPHPVMNCQFAKELSKALNRWPGPPFPAFIVRLLFGQKGEELMLTSSRVEPKKLLESGYTFQFPSLRQAFEHVV